MPVFDEDAIAHYGILRKSGRYPYGSGGDDTELGAATIFQSELKKLRSQGMSNTAIAKAFDLTPTELVSNIAIAGIIKKNDETATAIKLAATGMGPSAISREMYGTPSKESTVRGLLAPQAERKKAQLEDIADTLRQRVKETAGFIDVGKGQEHLMKIPKGKLDIALAMLKTEGYVVETIQQPQATTMHETRVRVLAKPGETWASINHNKNLIEPAKVFSQDGKTMEIWKEPLHLNPARLEIKYADEGGADRDGVIYIRPGVKDLSMGGASYIQTRIQVGKGHFIKGMAVQKEGLPPGVDVQFHTSKKNTGNKLDALKEVKKNDDGSLSEPGERFGAVFSQFTDPATGKVISHINRVNEDADWDRWSKTLSTQFLSKQKPDFVKRQLDVTYAHKKAQLEEIMSLTNPVVKKKLLTDYADAMDSSSVHLKAASLPRQKTHVILPVNTLKDHEVYAPGYKDGDRVVLIRYPHGGKFEIPELVVNNRSREARSIIPPSSRTAIGINSNVAKRLSGADFDGDTVVVIPNNRRRIESEPALAKLKNFDPQESYRGSDDGGKTMYPGLKKMKNTQTEMGKISNLITDMTVGGANHEELARAVRHSMVVIDAEKHGLDHVRSAKENSIQALKKKYQPGKYGGASTIFSRTRRPTPVPDFKRGTKEDGGRTDPRTGEPIYVPTGKTRPKRIVDPKTGEVTWERQPKLVKVEKGSRIPGTGVNDAYDLVSGPKDVPRSMQGTVVERHYADYSNKVRNLANQARLAELNTHDPRVNKSAKDVYHAEVSSLRAKVKEAQSNSPLERHAQRAAQVIIKMKRDANPDMTSEQLKRTRDQAIRTTRERLNAKPKRIDITDREWEAIQNHAVAANVLREVLSKADMDRVRKLAQPKIKKLMSPSNESLARALLSSGYTRAEVADQLNVSVSTLDRALD